ncbi:MAG TPA: hypothetical protein VF658_21665 [Pyrinomonadaceae bacterium]|jgi:hypothetical protein
MPTKKPGKATAKKATTKTSTAKTGAAKKAVKKSAGKSKTSREVRVRMYRQGLGDCFLLTFPRKPEPFHMLVDCGALKSKHYGSEEMKEVVRDIQQTIKDEMATQGAKARLDAVAATHEHWDHISGFADAQEVFDEIDFKKVWVAWTEEPENTAAAQLKKEFKKKKKAVENALALIPEEKKGDKRLGVYRKAISELFGFFGAMGASDGGGRQTTDAAWNYLLEKGRKEYCNPKKRPLEIEGVEGVRVYVLGPPEDPAYVRMRLSKKETYDEGKHALSLFDSFMAAVAGDDDDDFSGVKERAFPFDESYRVTKPEESPNAKFFKTRYGFGEGDEGEWRRIDHDWLNMAGELALHLDSYTNNTCLAFAIEIGEPGRGKVLLFPGDAQVGNWLSWGDLSWEVKDSSGEKQKVDIVDLLERTVLYKVGHHGSHNATLREKGLEKMVSPELVAMIPVHRKTAEDQAWEFPYPPLWKRLREKARGRVLLADADDISEIEEEAEKMMSPDEWQRFKNSTAFEPLYVEYRIPY